VQIARTIPLHCREICAYYSIFSDFGFSQIMMKQLGISRIACRDPKLDPKLLLF